ncbi:hypothetical protein [Nitrosomonas communis]|uniref:Uncharacterized protein n=1 Tax=Nitrosomonas communis TaxID=44574 RepID=A0A1I4SBP4_9PROT|nr:hypothetical protein [Nitrosomonas communis]SFM61908.1 hypothetical protein SAMN05421863_103930 [Nitrosomonas communis]
MVKHNELGRVNEADSVAARFKSFTKVVNRTKNRYSIYLNLALALPAMKYSFTKLLPHKEFKLELRFFYSFSYAELTLILNR